MSTPLRVVVSGASGRMGTAACAAVEAADDLELHARVGRGDDLAAALAGADVLVDLSVPDASPANVAAAVEAGVHAVVGTTGWDDDAAGRPAGAAGRGARRRRARRPQLLGRRAAGDRLRRPGRPLLRVRRGRGAAPPGQGRRPLRHRRPHRAPGGGGPGRGRRGPRARRHEHLAARGPRGGRGRRPRARGPPARAGGLPGGAARRAGERRSTLRHDSMDRSSFMPGVLLAVRQVVDRPGLTVGLEHWLDL